MARKSQLCTLLAPEPQGPAGKVFKGQFLPLGGRCFLGTQCIPSSKSQLPTPFLKILQGTFEHLQLLCHPLLRATALNRTAFNGTSVPLLLEAALSQAPWPWKQTAHSASASVSVGSTRRFSQVLQATVGGGGVSHALQQDKLVSLKSILLPQH